MRGVLPARASTSPDQRHNFEAVSLHQSTGGVVAARDEFQVPLDGDEPRLKPQFDQQRGDGGVRRDDTRFAIDEDGEGHG